MSGIRALQQQAAKCTDELLEISEQIGTDVLPLYNGNDMKLFDLQCRIALERLKRLYERMEQIHRDLQAVGEMVSAAAEQVSDVPQTGMTDSLITGAAGHAAAGVPAAGTDFAAAQSSDALAAFERRRSARITLQILEQNQAIAAQKRALLMQLLDGSQQTQQAKEAARKLEQTAQIMELRGALGREMERCRNANEK